MGFLFATYLLHFILFLTGTQTFSGSNRKQCNRDTFSATAPASLLERAPMKEFTADASGSLKVRAPSKATSKSKEIQAQWFLKPKIPVFNCVYDIKALPKPVLEENDLHRKNQFSKGKLQILPWLSGICFKW